MQTFLPYKDPEKCAKILDDKRLYKQVVECKQILKAIECNNNNVKYGYQNHPIVKMWQNYPDALKGYQMIMLNEWLKRRWNATISEYGLNIWAHSDLPEWIEDEDLHTSHRLNLLFKDPIHYSQYFDEEVPNNKPEYVWKI